MSGQFQVHLFDLSTAMVGDTFTVAFQLAGRLGVKAATGQGASDLTLTLDAIATSDQGMRVLTVVVGKEL